MVQDKAVEFETVIRRFGEATAAIERLRVLLDELQQAKKVQQRSAKVMSETSDTLRETCDTIMSFCDILRSALDLTLEALQSAENLSTGVELAAIRTGVEVIRGRIDEELAEAQQTLDTTRSELAQANERLSRIEGRLAGLPVRIRRRYNLDELFSDGSDNSTGAG